jgi:hypothetical protein
VVDAEIFFVTLPAAPVASAEIEELIWMAPHEAGSVLLAPLTSEVLLPLLAARRDPRPSAATGLPLADAVRAAPTPR